MKIRGFKVWLVAVACAVVLGSLVSGTYFYHKIKVEKPLFQLYDNITEVKNFKVQKKGQNLEITIDLKKTSNLQQTYGKLQKGTAKILGEKSFTIIINDQPSRELEEVFSDSQLLLYESLVRGNFSEMAQKIENAASEKNVKTKVTMDQENIFIQMQKEDKYLFEIIQWQNHKLGSNGIGSDDNVEGI